MRNKTKTSKYKTVSMREDTLKKIKYIARIVGKPDRDVISDFVEMATQESIERYCRNSIRLSTIELENMLKEWKKEKTEGH